MVKNLGQRYALSADRLSYVNYWFRHIWEYWWPLYPGVLLATTIAGLSLWQFVLFLLPLTAAAMAAGYWPLRASLRKSAFSYRQLPPRSGQPAAFLRELTPILLAIGGGLGFGLLFSGQLPINWATVAKELGLIVALLLAIAVVWRGNRLGTKQIRKIVFNPQLFEMFYMVAGILVFKGVLEDSLAIQALSMELVQWRIPLAGITVALPMAVGSISGITIAFVGTTFPVLISLVEMLGQQHLLLVYLMLAMVAGFVGVLFSPLHLCLLLSNQYFDTTLSAVYRLLQLPCGLLLGAGILYFWLAGYLL